MGVYDVQIMRSATQVGNVVFPVEVDVLTHGGEVLILEPLPAWDMPGWDYVRSDQLDQDGEVVMVPMLVNALDPETIVSAGYDYKERREVHHRLIDEMVTERGDVVMAAPSYLGCIDESQTYLLHPGFDWRTEQPGVWRFWEGLPVTDANRDAVKAILTVGLTRVTSSKWEQLAWLASVDEQGDGASATDLWAYVQRPELLTEYGESAVQEYIEWESEDSVIDTALAYQEMVDLGFLWDGSEVDIGPSPTLEFRPMSEVLADYPEALHLWNTILRRRNACSLRFINSHTNPNQAAYQENLL